MSVTENEEARFLEGLDLAAPTGAPAQEITPDEAPGEQPPQAEPDEPDQSAEIRSLGAKLLAGKYKTPEELERAYGELQSKLGEMGNELGLARQQAQQPQQPQYDEADIEDWIERDPRGAAVYAMQTGNELLYQRSLETLATENQFAALDLHARRVVAENQQQLVQQVIQPMQTTYHQQTLTSAWNSARAKLPEFDQLQEAMASAAERAPELLMPLQQGSQEQKERVFETLYYMARGMVGTPGQPPAPESAPSPQADSLAQRVAATVASATQVPQGTGQQTPADTQRLYDLWDQETGFSQR